MALTIKQEAELRDSQVMDSIRSNGGRLFRGHIFAVVTSIKKPKEPKEEEDFFIVVS